MRTTELTLQAAHKARVDAQRAECLDSQPKIRAHALSVLRSRLPESITLGTLDKKDYEGSPLLYITAKRGDASYAIRFAIEAIGRYEIRAYGADYDLPDTGRRYTPKYAKNKSGWPFERMAKDIEQAIASEEARAARRARHEAARTAAMGALEEALAAIGVPLHKGCASASVVAGPFSVHLSTPAEAGGRLQASVSLNADLLTARQAADLIEALKKIPAGS